LTREELLPLVNRPGLTARLAATALYYEGLVSKRRAQARENSRSYRDRIWLEKQLGRVLSQTDCARLYALRRKGKTREQVLEVLRG
jgi:hypothetical protein